MSVSQSGSKGIELNPFEYFIVLIMETVKRCRNGEVTRPRER